MGGSNTTGSCDKGGQAGGNGGNGAEAGISYNQGKASDKKSYEVGEDGVKNMTIHGATALVAQSLGGNGGDGGSSVDSGEGSKDKAGNGGHGGQGGKAWIKNTVGLTVLDDVQVFNTYSINYDLETDQIDDYDLITQVVNTAHGLIAQSGGGIGGAGGNANSGSKNGGAGGSAGNAGEANINNQAYITTNGGSAILAQSVGGFGGDAGVNKKGYGGGGGTGGDGGLVSVYNSGVLTINDQKLPLCSETVTHNCRITEDMDTSSGTLATLANSPHLYGVCDERYQNCDIHGAYGIFAQSVGGGGGNSGGSSGKHAIGADGGDAGFGWLVNVDNRNKININTESSVGILAQSIGGGGGAGGMAYSSAHKAKAIGGSGGGGGDGGAVWVSNTGSICTGGACGVALEELVEKSDSAGGAYGIFAQSIGGGGGAGGSAKAKSHSGGFLGLMPGKSLAIGGSGGDGGDGGFITVANQGGITTAEINSAGIFAQSVGGGGGSGGGATAMDASLFSGKAVAHGGSGGGGGHGGMVAVNCTSYGNASTYSPCQAQNITSYTPTQTLSTTVTPTLLSSNAGNAYGIATAGLGSTAIFAQSVGGGGGSGSYAIAVQGELFGDGMALAYGGTGGNGGSGNLVYAGTNGMWLYTLGDGAAGLLAQSIGGGGGAGSYALSLAAAAAGAPVAFSLGGAGGVGGGGGNVVAENPGGHISTAGDFSHGIIAQSIGGGGGAGGASVAASGSLVGVNTALAVGGSGEGGGAGGQVLVTNTRYGSNSPDIWTQGYGANAILAQSIGGGGGAGGNSYAASATLVGGTASVAVGGSSSSGGAGSVVDLDNQGNLVTEGHNAAGIVAQSIGGGGGAGSYALSLAAAAAGAPVAFSLGGAGGVGGGGGNVVAENPGGHISTAGDFSHGIIAQSIGGGGGAGGASVAASGSLVGVNTALAVGGSGEGGGAGGQVLVTNTRYGSNSPDIWTQGYGANAILAQSIGGGGGAGGNSYAASATLVGGTASVAVGGSSSSGGAGSVVDLDNQGNLVTEGHNAAGIVAQSIGGGGGAGGNATSVSGSVAGVTLGVALGGSGGGGGNSSDVDVGNEGSISTAGDYSHGILAQSIGGGGGAGGNAVAGSGTLAGGALSTAVGGTGGSGGNAGGAYVDNSNASSVISTQGYGAYGILAQSVGGGGGAGGSAMSGSATFMSSVSSSVALGGSASRGGTASAGEVNNAGMVLTEGANAVGIAMQSIGGGGGVGGNAVSVAGNITGGNLALAVGGAGGTGGTGGVSSINNSGVVATKGDFAHGLMAQSIGGGGGAGGMAVAGTATLVGVNVSSAVGGTGGGGGFSNEVKVINKGGKSVGLATTAVIQTEGAGANAILAQSLGGGGGAGGMTVAASAALGSLSATQAIGGAGGAGGTASAVTVSNNGNLITLGENASAVVAQSIGGKGGAGGTALSASGDVIGAGVSIASGGAGSTGGKGEWVTVSHEGTTDGTSGTTGGAVISTAGANAKGILAQSIGGNGGEGGMAVSAAGGLVGGNMGVSLGGSGGSGSASSVSRVANYGGRILTAGDYAQGIVAQSIGGNGGAGGMAVSGSASVTDVAMSVAVGGTGGSGGEVRGDVSVNNYKSGSTKPLIQTQGAGANAILAQSIGGDGGAGGMSLAAAVALAGDASAAVAVGGGGGNGGKANSVAVINEGTLVTTGNEAAALVAQAIGGSGGVGGFSASAGVNLTGNTASFALGGTGGNGGQVLGTVTVTNSSGTIQTLGNNAQGILAQSIGGNGGAGGMSLAATVSLAAENAAVSLGGAGGGGGTAGVVTVDSSGGQLMTAGDYSQGILAQSIGGNGGAGGMSVSGSVSLTGNAGAVSLGGSGNKGGAGKAVTVTNATGIVTQGYGASAIAAQSIGGFGGAGGASVSAGFSLGSSAAAVAVGGGAGTGASSDKVLVTNSGALTTLGGGAAAILAQSIGGDGGIGGLAVSGAVSMSNNGSLALGGGGAAGGTAGEARVDNSGNIMVIAEETESVTVPAVPNASVNQALEAWALVSGDMQEMPDDVTNLFNLITGQSNPLLSALHANAAGIMVQSIGGGGGAGGLAAAAGLSATDKSFDVAVGGDGGGGGTAGAAILNNTGSVITLGTHSPGLVAMSMGGQGGAGGFSASVGASGWSLGTAVASVGGDGGNGGRAGEVTVTTANSDLYKPVMTQGSQSPALMAMSIGGNGGTGGFDAAVGLSSLGSAVTGVGGNGGDGGTGGNVNVTSSQYLTTSGLMSPGILAMSIGGHGGMGGISAGVAESLVKSVAASVGGNGGAGGKSGIVDVSVNAPVVTYGNLSSGIVSQSIAGSGGMGGVAVSSVVTAEVIPTKKYKLNIGGAAGGEGGAGGQAGDAYVESNSVVQTYGFLSHAVVAQSVGGTGGMGGIAVDGSFDVTLNVIPGMDGGDRNLSFALAVGGEGGIGGNAGLAQVDQRGSLVTGYGIVENGAVGSAFLSSGILAQSIGGSGGMGGSAAAIAAGNSPTSATLAVGGMGGAGGHAGSVVVNSNVDCLTSANCTDGITTFGAGSAAIKAQSIGGGGGSGGIALSAASVGLLPSKVGVGGAGGDGGDAGHGGTVEINVGGSLTTVGLNAPGILAQSVGGGGGDGGASLSGNYDLATAVKKSLSLFGVKVEDDDDSLVSSSIDGVKGVYQDVTGEEMPDSLAASSALAVGGDGGAGGNAAAVTVNSTAQIVTGAGGFGYQSAGIMAQSVGGGGGNGGFAGIGQNGAVTGSVLLGGNGGVAGDGSTVNVTAANLIKTTGMHSTALVAQSIGGGGGNAGHIYDGTEAIGALSSGVGGSGGNGGSASTVTVTSSATLITNGLHSGGIMAQSIGGGGGNANSSILGNLVDALPVPATVGATNKARVGVTTLDEIIENGAQVGALDERVFGQSGADAGAAFAVNLGGSDGVAGNGGNVTVSNTGNIFTGAEVDNAGNVVASENLLRTAGSTAILAQSIGGGGGSSHEAAVDANWGQSMTAKNLGGLFGSDDTASLQRRAGNVTVLNTGSLITYGANSAGIIAQSIGGGGGVSGTFSATTNTLEGMAGATSNALRLGGGMAESYAGMVSVCDTRTTFDTEPVVDYCSGLSDQGQAIVTEGVASHGILAQSIGGGGGYAAVITSAVEQAVAGELSAGNFDLTVGEVLEASSTDGVAVAAHLGGTDNSSGNRSGNGALIWTATDVVTRGDAALGLLGQSVGGGGGLLVSHASNAGTGDYHVKGQLGGFGSGANATIADTPGVVFQGSVLTEGDLATAVIGQGVAGGGGIFLSLGKTVGTGGTDTVELLLGAADGEGNGSNNKVVWGAMNQIEQSALMTSGAGALGIISQSVGAGGGFAASHTGSASAGAVEGIFKLGSTGVAGATDEYWTALTSSTGFQIATTGVNAVGALTQSVSAGGGLAIDSHDSLLARESVAVSFDLGFDNAGKAGGSVGATKVEAVRHSINTEGDNASAMLMQSVAGGGGTALFASSAVEQGGEVEASFHLGGNPSDGMAMEIEATLGILGNRVSLPSYLVTAGDNAFGLVAQSIASGGGLAALTVAASEEQLAEGATLGLTLADSWLGRADGAVSSKHYASVVNLDLSDYNIVTSGRNSVGLVAQSIGGGGGVATALAADSARFGGSLQLGASGGGSGAAAGAINLTASASKSDASLISTAADFTPAMLVQSIGGGGGLAMLNVSDLTLGGNTGSQGNTVSINNAASIVTQGKASIGLIAQSIGGGGGVGWSLDEVTLGGAASGSHGKNVSVTQNGDIYTTGDYAYGILAQSIGGGGGLALSEGDVLATTVLDGVGNGGNVSVTVNGNVVTEGYGAHGVVAQSVANGGGLVLDMGNTENGGLTAHYSDTALDGTPGLVNVYVNGNIAVYGENAHGIFATNSDDPVVWVAEGSSVTGGEGGSAVYFDAGRNELHNSGTLSTMDGAAGLVVHSIGGDTRINNEASGVLHGAIRLAADGNNLLHNLGTVLAGTEIDLGDGVFRNEGILGLAEGVGHSVLNGDLTQSETGSLMLRFDQRDGTADRLHVTGTAELAGVITPLLVNAGHIRPGTRATQILSADGEIDLSGLRVLDSALLHHTLTEENGEITVTTTADFTPAGLRGDGERLGTVLAGLQGDGGTRLSRGITALLAQLPDVQALDDAYDTVASGGISAVPMMSLQNASLVMDTVTARLDGWRADELASGTRVQHLTQGGDTDSGPRGWLSLVGNTSNGEGLSRDATAMVLGADMVLGEQTLVGASVSASRLQFDLDRPDAWATGDEFGLNLYGLHRAGNAYASAMLFAASNRVTYHSSLRGFGYDLAGETTFDNRTLGGRLEAGYAFTLPSRRVTLTPFVAVQPTQVYQDDAREVYNAELGIGVNFRDAVIESLPADLGVQIGSHWTLAGGARLSSFARLAWRHDFEPERTIQRDFHGIRLRDSSLPEAEDTAIARLGMQYSLGRALSVTGEVEGQWSSPYDTVGGSIGLQYRW
ncbi:putative outer membrane autotransporter barrel domain-containing protein [Isoalcanivorax pacificus W11-5]|uniref:Putative outer membrane autotransporter barrel domain-containing protein n=2 Tax=Isoalcanivorax TaxID=3020833 RepID=A0A0B4XLA8_9GAMM|nr:putative outer membrane autotransporter barrel domain-containing protein [Isoalcanivorax pacificus W11-5]